MLDARDGCEYIVKTRAVILAACDTESGYSLFGHSERKRHDHGLLLLHGSTL